MDKRATMQKQSYTNPAVFMIVFGLLLTLFWGVGIASAADPQESDVPQGASNLGDLVWHDLNGNGEQDSGEPGIPGVFVRVWTDDGDNSFDPSTGGGRRHDLCFYSHIDYDAGFLQCAGHLWWSSLSCRDSQ